MAEKASKELKDRGAEVELFEYGGGHGWRAGLYEHIRDGIAWLEKHHADPARE
jgi:hypothetical protein